MTEMLKDDCHGYVLKISERMNTRKHLNMKKVCIKMVPAVIGNKPEIGRNEILLLSKIEVHYLNTVGTSQETVAQCNSEISIKGSTEKIQSLKIDRSKNVKIEGQYHMNQFFQDQVSGPL
jgi:hypothetical protein